MKWRPKGLTNPYPALGSPPFNAFEEGVDAVLEALKKRGEYCRNHSSHPGNEGLGWLVLIPDDEAETRP